MGLSKIKKQFSPNLLLLLITICLFPLISGFGRKDALNSDRLKYIAKYKDIAISEMERAGVPASIKLAQGILESNSGKSELARKASNHFGMKCGSQWKGKTYHIKDDDYNDSGELMKSCFRVFKGGDESYIAHSEFLRDPRKAYRYGFLFRLDPTDYKRWAFGLKKAGYATNPKYPDLLIKLIEDYELDIYDKMSSSDVDSGILAETPDVISKNLVIINSVNTAIAQENDTPSKISERTGIDLKRIFRYNDKISGGGQELKAGDRVFLQPKRLAYRGRKKYHYVREGQSIYDISQLYGVKVSRLLWRNRYNEGQEPAFGAKIKLRGWKVSKKDAPKVRSKSDLQGPATIPVRDMDQDPDLEFDPDAAEIDINDFEVPNNSNNSNNGNSTPNENDDLEPVIISDDSNLPPVVEKPSDLEFPVKDDPDNSDDNNGSDFQDDLDDTGSANSVYHTVNKGETLYRISKMYQISVADLKKLNNLNSNHLNIGQRLLVN